MLYFLTFIPYHVEILCNGQSPKGLKYWESLLNLLIYSNVHMHIFGNYLSYNKNGHVVGSGNGTRY